MGASVGSAKQLVTPGTVLLCRINPRINRAWVVGDSHPAPKIASTEWLTFPRSDTIEPRFLCYFLQRDELRDRLASNASGIGGSLMRVNRIALQGAAFRYPPLDDQRRIVEEIEKQLTRLESGVAALKRVQANLKRYRAAILKAACEGRLLKTDLSTWKRLTLPALCADSPNSIRRGPFGSAIKKEFFVPDGYKVYEQQNAIYDNCSLGSYFVSETKFRELSGFEVKPGDLIISCSGTVGRIAIVPAWAKPGIINQALLKLTLNQSKISNAYFVIMFRHKVQEILVDAARGSAMQNITGVADLKRIEWPVPPLAGQERIAAEVERRLSVVEELSAVVTATLQRSTRLRQSVLAVAFSGNL